jgi:hypothetical protein
VNRSLTIAALLFLIDPLVIYSAPRQEPDCSAPKHPRHKVSCLCGEVQVCSGDICGGPQDYGLDDDITVELRNKAGTTVLDSKKVVLETHEKEGTTQAGTRVSYKTTGLTFCFEGKSDGDYLLDFVLYKNGVPQPAVEFPTNYSRGRHKTCDSVYMVEPFCSK